MNDFLSSHGLAGLAQTSMTPVLLGAFAPVAWRAARLGRRLAMFFLFGMMVLPWVVGYGAYWMATHDTEQAVRDVAALREQLHSLWLAPQGLTAAGVMTLVIVLLRTRHR